MSGRILSRRSRAVVLGINREACAGRQARGSADMGNLSVRLRRSGQALHPPVGGRGDERAARVPPAKGIAPAEHCRKTRCLPTLLPPTLKVKTQTELPSPHLSQRGKAGDLAT